MCYVGCWLLSVVVLFGLMMIVFVLVIFFLLVFVVLVVSGVVDMVSVVIC